MANQRIYFSPALMLFLCFSLFQFYVNSQPVIPTAPAFVKMSGGVIWPSLLLRPSELDSDDIYSQNPEEIVQVATPRKRAIMRLGKRALMRLGKK